jgi:NAD(P)-dependent dehydrogenase (short-subunit alcohol dehydrogenase family)
LPNLSKFITKIVGGKFGAPPSPKRANTLKINPEEDRVRVPPSPQKFGKCFQGVIFEGILYSNGSNLFPRPSQSLYGAQKAGSDKMMADIAKELRAYNVAAVSIWMGSLDTERSRAYLSKLAENTIQGKKFESPQFTGRVISALYRSRDVMALSGQALIGAELGLKLSVTDIDGSQPASYRDTLGSPPELHPSLKA